MNQQKPSYTQSVRNAQTDDVIDPGYTYPDNYLPTPSLPAEDDVIDPDYSYTPEDGTVIQPGTGNRPPFITIIPQPIVPCLFCSSNQWTPASIRFLNASTGYNPVNIYVAGQLVYSELASGEVTRYTRAYSGVQTVTVMATNGYVYVRKSVRFSDGMSTIAIVNTGTGLDLVSISDNSCSTGATTSCIRVSNLAYYSGDINVRMGTLIFSSVAFKQTVDFSVVRSGNYTIHVSRSARPATTLLSTNVTLNPNRIYTLYVMNWNASADAIQTLLVEDRRS